MLELSGPWNSDDIIRTKTKKPGLQSIFKMDEMLRGETAFPVAAVAENTISLHVLRPYSYSDQAQLAATFFSFSWFLLFPPIHSPTHP